MIDGCDNYFGRWINYFYLVLDALHANLTVHTEEDEAEIHAFHANATQEILEFTRSKFKIML